MPRVARPDPLGGGGQHVDVVVGQHPVLLGDQVEVGEPGDDRMVRRGGADVDGVRDEVVLLALDRLVRRAAGMAGELAADQVQVVGAVAVGVGDAAVPTGQAGAGRDRRTQPGQLVRTDPAHRDALHDEVDGGEVSGVGVDPGRVLDPGGEALRVQERQEQVGGLDRPVPFPSAPDDESSAGGHGVHGMPPRSRALARIPDR
ncbi:hypothetical protein Prubr_72680 [Polymorphospora rubra]|uniref:Uncharacterized protein n=1 Tax=Polymorphospora rubra TaxID=338584 RepID=A0A810NAK2_9ACTN|nr:hypothetical protein Prubr_72680 [Polymorphospora rubra]